MAAQAEVLSRCANLLVEGLDPGSAIGASVAIGDVVIDLPGELRPCELMDDNRPALCAALRPPRRGGALAIIRTGGVLQVGMPILVVSG